MLNVFSKLFFLIFIISIDCHGLESQAPMPKSWPFTCTIANCQTAIAQCINQCNGEVSCKSCVISIDPLCVMCANDIFSQNSMIPVDGQKYFECVYKNSVLQTNVCQIYCKGNSKLYGECKQLQTYEVSVCFCYNLFNGVPYRTINGNRQVYAVASSLMNSNFAVGFTNGSITIFDKYGQFIRSLVVSSGQSNIIEKITYFSQPANQFLDIGVTGTFGTRFISEWGTQLSDVVFTSIHGKAVVFHTDYIAYAASSLIHVHLMMQGSYSSSPDLTLRGHTNVVFSLLTLPNSDLISGSADNTIKIWDIANGSLKKTLTGHTNIVSSLILLENGYIASGSYDRSIRIWNTNSGTEIKMISTLHNGNIRSIVLLPDGKIASGSDDYTIKIWDKEFGTLTKTLGGHTNYIMDLAVNANNLLVSVSLDNSIRLWS